MFNEDFEEDTKGSKVTATSAIASFTQSVLTFDSYSKSIQVESAVVSGAAAGASVGAAGGGEKTIREMLEVRETELKELEQLQEIQNIDYIEALASDLS
jgi:hypothetical protein